MNRLAHAPEQRLSPATGMTFDRPYFRRRVMAYILDCGVLFLVLAPIAVLAPRLHGHTPDTALGVWLSTILHFSIPVWAYFAGSDAYLGGRTLGKRSLGLRVEALHGRRLGRRRALVRTGVKLLPWELSHGALVVGLVAPQSSWLQWSFVAASVLGVFGNLAFAYWTGGQSAIHDRMVSTRVVPAAHRDGAV